MISVRTVVRVRYAETDKMGVVYHGNYFTWFEVGRCELLRTSGHTYRSLEEQHGVQLPVIEASCQYFQPGHYDDEIEIAATGHLISHVRLAFDYEAVRCEDRVKLAAGRTVHAAVNLQGRPCRLPDHIRTLFA